MKNKISIILLSIVSMLILASCYPDGGTTGNFINSPEERIVGSWQLTHTYLNGEEIDSTPFYANKPSPYYYFYADHPMQLMNYHNGEYRYSNSGFWYFSNKNKNLNIDISFLGHHYEYTADISKFTKKELIYDYVDEYGNQWELHLNTRSGTSSY